MHMRHLTAIIILCAALASALTATAQRHCGRGDAAERCGGCRHEYNCGGDACRDYRDCRESPYFIGDNDVFFDGQKIKGASASSFRILREGYAKDSWNVYYLGRVIKGASADSFTTLGWGYAKDTWNVYFDGKKIKSASSDSFQLLRDGYAKDTWNVYFRGKKIDGASPESFRCDDHGYARDTWHSYRHGQRLR